MRWYLWPVVVWAGLDAALLIVLLAILAAERIRDRLDGRPGVSGSRAPRSSGQQNNGAEQQLR